MYVWIYLMTHFSILDEYLSSIINTLAMCVHHQSLDVSDFPYQKKMAKEI